MHVSGAVLRTLVPGDEAALDAFLAPRWQSSMFLRGNVRAAGLVDRGRPVEGTYVAAWAGDTVVSVVAHYWNGLLAVQAPDGALLPPLVHAAVAATGRRVAGFAGPRAQVDAARAALGLQDAPTAGDDREDLFALTLDALRAPAPLVDGSWRARAPRAEERDLLADWRARYEAETRGLPPASADDAVRRAFRLDDAMRVLVVDERPVAVCTFITQLPDVVLVGGVFTPAELRGRGYGRAVVAAALAEARGRGVTRALLFTAENNVAARAAYAALGFALVPDVTLLLLR